MMASLWLTACVLAAMPDSAAARDSGSQQQVESSARPAAEKPVPRNVVAQKLRQRICHALRSEATTRGDQRRTAIIELVELAKELQSDTALSVDERQRLANTVRIRLTRVTERLSREIAAGKAAAKRGGEQPASVPTADDLQHILAQQLQQFGQNMARNASPADRGEALLELIKTTIRPSTWDDQGGPGRAVLFPRFGLLNSTSQPGTFGPCGPVPADAVAAGGTAKDDGEALVELIRATIAPATWDNLGGPGSIVYYRPLRVLVIRQTAEVHGRVGDVLGQMRQ
jgi:hypothetical protein